MLSILGIYLIWSGLIGMVWALEKFDECAGFWPIVKASILGCLFGPIIIIFLYIRKSNESQNE